MRFRVLVTGESSQVTQTATSPRYYYLCLWPQARGLMAFLGFCFRRQLPRNVRHLVPTTKWFRPAFPEAPLRRLHGSRPLWVAKGPRAKSRGPEKQYEHPQLDKADALVGGTW